MDISRRAFLESYKKRNYKKTTEDNQPPPATQETVEEWMERTGKVPEQLGYCIKSNARSLTMRELQTLKNGGKKK